MPGDENQRADGATVAADVRVQLIWELPPAPLGGPHPRKQVLVFRGGHCPPLKHVFLSGALAFRPQPPEPALPVIFCRP